MPVVCIETLKKVPRYLDDGRDSYASCATDLVAGEVYNGARCERPGCSDEYVHVISIGEERDQSTENREERREKREAACLCSVLSSLCSSFRVL
jgi:hypothetical protein